MLYSIMHDIDLFIFFFFFQAEDGIRDPLVTGVQTCALPISGRRRLVGQTPSWRSPSVASTVTPTLGAPELVTKSWCMSTSPCSATARLAAVASSPTVLRSHPRPPGDWPATPTW